MKSVNKLYFVYAGRARLLSVFATSFFLAQNVAVAADLSAPPVEMAMISANWCAPCKAIKKDLVAKGYVSASADLEQAAVPPFAIQVSLFGKAFPVNVRIFNVDKMSKAENADLTRKYGTFDAFPSFKISMNGQFDFSAAGGASVNSILSRARQFLLSEFSKGDRAYPLFAPSIRLADDLYLAQKIKPPAEVVLLGTGSAPALNPYFNGEVLSDIQEDLARLGAGGSVVTLYGNGRDKETLATVDDDLETGPSAPVRADLGADRPSLFAVVKSAREKGIRNLLMVLVGHANPLGFELWNEKDLVGPQELAIYLGATKAQTVTVSGTCNSGVFAGVSSCGFYAARGERPASGCSRHLIKRADRTDYVTKFFDALSDPSRADLDKSGGISFAEAHWYAYRYGDELDVPYTDLDFLVDELQRTQVFEDQFGKTAWTRQELESLLSFLSAPEKQVFGELPMGQIMRSSSPRLSLYLELYDPDMQREYDFSSAYSLNFAGIPDLLLLMDSPSSQSRGLATPVSSPKAIQLIRRALGRRLLQAGNGEEKIQALARRWRDVERCESQEIAAFTKAAL
jgi:thiol-disulfide isomerase/thioredoxin